jgi:hypothetical protein
MSRHTQPDGLVQHLTGVLSHRLYVSGWKVIFVAEIDVAWSS